MANPSGEKKHCGRDTERGFLLFLSRCREGKGGRSQGAKAKLREQGRGKKRNYDTVIFPSYFGSVQYWTPSPPSPNICESKTLFGRREKEKGQRDFFVHEKKGRGKSQTKSDLFCRLPSKKNIFGKRKKTSGVLLATTCFVSSRHLAVVKRGNPFN